MPVRKLPTIDLNGVNYTIDARLSEMRRTDRPWDRIPFSELKDEGDFYTVNFEKGTDNKLATSAFYEWGALVECQIPLWALIEQPREISNNN